MKEETWPAGNVYKQDVEPSEATPTQGDAELLARHGIAEFVLISTKGRIYGDAKFYLGAVAACIDNAGRLKRLGQCDEAAQQLNDARALMSLLLEPRR